MPALPFDRADAAAGAAAYTRSAHDKAMLKMAAERTRVLGAPRRAIYWTDLFASAVAGYAALVGAVTLPVGWAVACGIVSVLALYRAMSFRHEVSHVKPQALTGFRAGFNALGGVPMPIPSFNSSRVHHLPHARTPPRPAAQPRGTRTKT